MIYLLLFLEFFKVGLFCFGGAFGMIPLIEETVIARGWVTESEFYNFLGVCESTPGPIAVNMATYVGAQMGGILGSITATLGVVLPSFIIILLVAAVLKNFTKNKYFGAFMKGVQPVVIALILYTGAGIALRSLGLESLSHFEFSLAPIIIFALILLIFFGVKLIFKKKLPAVMLIIISAALGVGVSVLCEAFAV